MSDLKENPRQLARALRQELGISVGHASELARRLKTPSYRIAMDAQSKLGIDPRWWMNEAGQDQ